MRMRETRAWASRRCGYQRMLAFAEPGSETPPGQPPGPAGETPALRGETTRPHCDLLRAHTSYIHTQQPKYPAASVSLTVSTNNQEEVNETDRCACPRAWSWR
jgi:hypothetical protein